MIDISLYKPRLAALCRTLAVKRLELAGSAARDDFNPDSSDIDLLCEFEGNGALFNRYFDLKSGLESIFGRKVDLIQMRAIRNPYVRQSMEHDRIAIYEA